MCTPTGRAFHDVRGILPRVRMESRFLHVALSPRESNRHETLRQLGKLSSIGIEFAATVGFGVYIGYKLDGRYGWYPWGILTGSVLGIAIGFYQFFKAALPKHSGESDDES